MNMSVHSSGYKPVPDCRWGTVGRLRNAEKSAVVGNRFPQSEVIPEEIGQSGCPNAKLVPDWTTEQVLPWACRSDKGISVRNSARPPDS